MDILQIALVFLIILLSIFLSILGLQVFLILRDLRKDLNKLDKFLRSEISVSHEVERVEVVEGQIEAKAATKSSAKTQSVSSKPRFYKKVLK
jgi:hypothetical protein